LGGVDVPQRGAEALVGRRAELALIRAFLGRLGSGGEALLLAGDPGVGKTVMLDVSAEMALAAGAQVLRAAGVEFEADLPFSGLHQALVPLFGQFGLLSSTHRDALNVALGLGDGAPPGRMVVCSATLALLREAASNHPLLLVVDDLPWLDRASAGVFGFVARRLVGSCVGLLAALRSGEESFFDRAGLPELELGPLDKEAADSLVSARFPGLAPRVRQRVLAEAEGNPLALLELPAALSGPHRALVAPSAVLPVSRRLQALFSTQVRQLPRRARQLLLLTALDGTGDLRVLHARKVGAGESEYLTAAERTRLLYVDEDAHRLAFRHPLIRSAVVQLSTDDQRRQAHGTLAGLWADLPDRQAWHLAEAAAEPDESVANLLEQAAHRVLRRGDAVGAVAALTRASELSPGGADRSRRLAEAAYIGADVTGELRNVSQLLAAARQADPNLSGSLQAAVAASYLLLNADGDVNTAHHLLVGAINDRAEGSDAGDHALEEALHTLMLVCFFGGRAELWEPFYQAIRRLSPPVPAALYLSSKTFTDPVRTGAAVLEQLDTLIDSLPDETDPTRIVRIGMAAIFVDRLPGCRHALEQVVRDGREGGAIASAINASILLGFDDFLTGQWDRARQLVDEALELCETHGYKLLAWPGRLVQALLAAARGDYDRTRQIADEMIGWAAPRQVRSVQWYAWQARTLAELGQGDFEEAYQQATALSPAGTLASHVPHALYVVMDLVEAAVHTGRHAEAAAHVAAMREGNIAGLSPRIALLVAGSAAIAAPDDSARRLFEQTLAIPGIDRWPFELARVQLAYGERLRRARAVTESRVRLMAALETFERLGARPWTDRAASELRAAGQARPPTDVRDRDALTPQEHEIAMLAAAGLSNKEIGQRLFLSHRTVGNHLLRIFRKVGITSRAALRDALASPPASDDRGRPSH
jgi:DNA-binding CsgD family transcriptional regulator/tetratricopeptide (TPR) repeat protein